MSLLLQAGPAQIHLCPLARLHSSAGALVFKAWNSLLPPLQKFVLKLYKYLPSFCHPQDRAENTKMNETGGLPASVVIKDRT